MKTSEAVSKRIRRLLDEKEMSQYRLCKNMGIPEGTLRNIINAVNKSVNLNSILQICRGIGITTTEFFNDPMFENPDLDID